jgi:hypothetical protein
MRPKSTTSDLPTSYDVKTHLHNQFTKHMKSLKKEITISILLSDASDNASDLS